MHKGDRRCAVVVAIFALILSACGANHDPAAEAAAPGTPDATAARATLIAMATAGLVPDGLVIATATPDLRAAMTPDEASVRLSSDPKIGALLTAIAQNDVDGFLALIDWKPWRCGGRGDDGCPAGVAPGTPLPKINTGGDTFYVSVSTLRPYVERLMRGSVMTLRYASQGTEDQSKHLLGFDGPAKGAGFPPMVDASSALTGLFLGVDASAANPVQHIDIVTEGMSVAWFGIQTADPASQRILTFAE